MKHSRRNVERKAHAIPRITFEQQRLTSFAGLVILQPFLANIDLKVSLARCFRHVRAGKVYGQATVFLQLVIHLLLGYRDLRQSAYYRDDPMVKRVLGLRRLPDVATVMPSSRASSKAAWTNFWASRSSRSVLSDVASVIGCGYLSLIRPAALLHAIHWPGPKPGQKRSACNGSGSGYHDVIAKPVDAEPPNNHTGRLLLPEVPDLARQDGRVAGDGNLNIGISKASSPLEGLADVMTQSLVLDLTCQVDDEEILDRPDTACRHGHILGDRAFPFTGYVTVKRNDAIAC